MDLPSQRSPGRRAELLGHDGRWEAALALLDAEGRGGAEEDAVRAGLLASLERFAEADAAATRVTGDPAAPDATRALAWCVRADLAVRRGESGRAAAEAAVAAAERASDPDAIVDARLALAGVAARDRGHPALRAEVEAALAALPGVVEPDRRGRMWLKAALQLGAAGGGGRSDLLDAARAAYIEAGSPYGVAHVDLRAIQLRLREDDGALDAADAVFADRGRPLDRFAVATLRGGRAFLAGDLVAADAHYAAAAGFAGHLRRTWAVVMTPTAPAGRGDGSGQPRRW